MKGQKIGAGVAPVIPGLGEKKFVAGPEQLQKVGQTHIFGQTRQFIQAYKFGQTHTFSDKHRDPLMDKHTDKDRPL